MAGTLDGIEQAAEVYGRNTGTGIASENPRWAEQPDDRWFCPQCSSMFTLKYGVGATRALLHILEHIWERVGR